MYKKLESKRLDEPQFIFTKNRIILNELIYLICLRKSKYLIQLKINLQSF